ncbi:threonine deaminase [Mycoemilia scoparia]|uniref:Threonine dehydratase n=1 Tax=Mycoemilia scoparia TaxID=417184 RepID=A0A9W8DQ85_9FUNG|nr:threonine deaminase [Mycoemilia scoparia]
MPTPAATTTTAAAAIAINGQQPQVEEELDYLQLILTAPVYEVADETPLTAATNLSTKTNNRVYLKREDLQSVFSFKLRGAYNKIYHLTDEEKQQGVIACSAGNHAQGVALAAKKLGIKATIVMPKLTPEIKWKNVKRLGAQVVLHGDDFDSAKEECTRLTHQQGYVNIPPFDDPYVIAGQGTIGLEILRQLPRTKQHIEAIFVGVGGGGIIAGISAYVKRVFPGIKVIGVEAVDSTAMTSSLKAGKRVLLDQVGLFADGAAVRMVGEETFRLAQKYVDEMVLVTNDEICAAIKDVFEDTRSVLEPAGALATAGLKKYAREKGLADKTLVSVCSGANMNFNRLRFVAERAELGEQREALLTVVIPETPGSFIRFYDEVIYPRDVTEFSYRYNDPEKAHIFTSFTVNDRSEVPHILQELEKRGMKGTDISDNEMAKCHARYMVGGRSTSPGHVKNERLYRFEFPERPGALVKFLHGIQTQWNISLFHYRNFGQDVGRVLVGIQVPPPSEEEKADGEQLPRAFKNFLDTLQYNYYDETDNPVYRDFMV